MPDLRLALRSLLRTPGFTAVAILTLALGVGANTAMFSVLNEVMLRPLPYPEIGRLERIFRATEQQPEGSSSFADFLDLQAAAGTYGSIAGYAPGDLSLADPGRPAETGKGLRVSANFLATFGIAPALGRDFLPDEAARGRHHVLIVSHRCWQDRFGGDRGIVGRTVRVDGIPHRIVGVLPAAFSDWRYLGWVDFLRPLGLTDAEAADRLATPLRLVGRRDSSVTPAAGTAFLAGFGARLAADFPGTHAGTAWRTVPLQDFINDAGTGISLAMLVGLSGFVVLIACSNLANFLLARTLARAREFAVRSALGASRLRLIRPLLLESLLLSLGGGAGALLVAAWATDWLSARSRSDEGHFVPFALDWSVFGWALGASLLTALAFGLAPALFTLRLDLNHTLKTGGRGAAGSRGERRLRQFLIVGQFALALVLFAGAALFARGLHEVNHRRQGWESDRLVTGAFQLPAAAYPGPAEIAAFHRLALERLAALPGVEVAGLASSLPFLGPGETRRFVAADLPPPERGREPVAAVSAVSPDYFAAVGTRLVRGRAFAASDRADAPPVYIVNRAFARSLFGDADPVGRRLAPAGESRPAWGEIVGVADDVVSTVPGPHPVALQLYRPLAQAPAAAVQLAVRSRGPAPGTLVTGIRAAMTALDPDLPVNPLRPAETAVARTNYQLAVLRDMLLSFAILGLGLAALGIYGTIARLVAQRTPEFGIRLALGADRADLLRLVLGSGLRLALVGAGFGLVGAYGVSRLLAAGFPGIDSGDPLVFAGATSVLLAVALVACWLPARRAACVDPVIALRHE